MKSEYDEFATDYDWIFSDERLAEGPYYLANLQPLLKKLPPQASILDSACGTGLVAQLLARQGFRVTGTDASAGMVAQARQHAARAGLDISFTTCPWQQLPDRLNQQFDMVLCCGNAIGHCRDEDDMLQSLRGIQDVLQPGGLFVVDTRNWEKLLAERKRFVTHGLRERHGKRCILLYVWTFPASPSEPLLAEVVFLFEEDGQVSLRDYSVTYYPFRVEELLERMRSAGFHDVETNYSPERDRYHVSARR